VSEVEDLRAATREAHEVMKDLRGLIKDCRALLSELRYAAATDVDEQIKAEVAKGLAAYSAANIVAIQEAERLIYQRFATIGDILMGETKSSVKVGNSIKQMVEEWANDG